MRSTLSIHVTDLCNSKCSFCVVGSPLYTKNTVGVEQIRQFLSDNAGQDFSVVNLHGGEPTIDPHFLDILEHARALRFPEVHLQTNGIKLADRDYAKRLVDLQVRLFIVSLHGDLPSVHDEQTHTHGGLTRTIDGIRNVKALGAQVRTNTVITMRNVERLPQICELACELGVDHVNFSNIHPVGSAFFSFDRLVPRFRVMHPALQAAVMIALSQQRQITLEGFPYCTMPGLESLHLNEHGRRIRMLMRGQVIEDYDAFMNETCRKFGKPCQSCDFRSRCGGVYPEYVQYRGWEEFLPTQNPRRVSLPVVRE